MTLNELIFRLSAIAEIDGAGDSQVVWDNHIIRENTLWVTTDGEKVTFTYEP